MVTYDPGVRARAADVAALVPARGDHRPEPARRRPGGTRAYVSVGDDDARAFAGRLPGAASRATGLFIEQREALVLTGAGTAEEAAEMIGARVPIVVVSLGADGAVGLRSTAEPSQVSGFDVGHVDRHHRRRRPVRRRLGVGRRRRASPSTTRCAGPRSTPRCRCACPTGAGGATPLAEFIEEGTPPRAARAASAGNP